MTVEGEVFGRYRLLEVLRCGAATGGHANRIMKLTKNATTSMTLPFNGLKGPQSVVVDAAGNVYVADAGNNGVLKLPAN